MSVEQKPILNFSFGDCCSKIPLCVMLFILILVVAFSASRHAQAQTQVKKQTKQVKEHNPIPDNRKILTVKEGSSLLDMLLSVNVERNDAINAIAELSNIYAPNNLKVGQKVVIDLFSRLSPNEGFKIRSIDIAISSLENVKVYKINKDLFLAQKVSKPIVNRVINTKGVITSTIFGTARQIGIPNYIVLELIKIFSYDVDFARDIQKGDVLKVLYEQPMTESGEILYGGKIIYAMLRLHNKDYAIYRFMDDKGEADYFYADGSSIKKSLLRTPVDGARITSKYGARKHPILGFTKMHRGVDFGAPSGTAVYSAGEGVVREAGKKGSYGNYIRIMHSDGYATAYAHLSRFNTGIRRGKKVKQGELIAFVGTTGRSTGPHLHYEVLKNNQHINPQSLTQIQGKILSGLYLGIFKQYKKQIDNLMAKTPVYGD